MNSEKASALGKKASIKRLQFCNFKLDFLLEITLAINESSNVANIVEQYLNILHEQLNIGKVLLFNYDEKWQQLIVSGVSQNIANEIKMPDDLIYYKQITPLTNALNKQLTVFDVLIPVTHQKDPIAYLLIGDIDEEQDGMSPTIKHLRFIQTLTNIIVVAIENKRLFDKNLIREGIKKELDLASRMQAMLIPNQSSLPNNEYIKTDAYYLPHYEVGGDYYDVIRLRNYEYGFCIADVAGKGISAALLMSNFQANLRALFTSNHSLEDIVRDLNKRVVQNTNGEKFITLFIGQYNCITHNLRYINAGHNYPLFYNKQENTIKYLYEGCVGIGMLDEIPNLTTGCETITSGTRILLYTDGTTELENIKEEAFNVSTMAEDLMRETTVSNVIKKIVSDLEEFKGDLPYSDDVTLLAFEFLA